MNPATLTALESFPRQLEAHFSAIPIDFRQWGPTSWDGVPSEAFTAIEQICHIRDIEIEGYHLRIQRMLNEPNPTLASIESEALAKERNYSAANASEVLAAFRAARAKTIAIISGLTDAQWGRTAIFERYGALSLRSLAHYLCSHDQQHLAGLQWLLGKIEASRTQTFAGARASR
jgi:DinB superfamily